MKLTPEERARWDEFKRRHVHPIDRTERAERIINRSREGATCKQLRDEIEGAWEFIAEVRCKGRREGAY